MKIRNCRAADIGRISELLGQLWPDIDVNTAEMRRCFEHDEQSPTRERRMGFVETGPPETRNGVTSIPMKSVEIAGISA